ncbi:hypothetical protein AcW1_006442 [Taiwanofungus camphoratus]|nr:hypothetical protein AcW1_006442 [Antrodia cinnamomea]
MLRRNSKISGQFQASELSCLASSSLPFSKAYQVLSDSNLRAVYDKNGAKMLDKEGGVGMEDAAGFFANVFGGERFKDYIGEISLMKEMTSVATTMMTDGEKAEIEKELNETTGTSPAPTPAVIETPHAEGVEPHLGTNGRASPPRPASRGPTPAPSPSPSPRASPGGASTEQDKEAHATTSTSHGKSVSPASSANLKEQRDMHGKKRAKLTLEQKKKLQELEDERRKGMEDRVKTLTAKLADRLRPFVEAKHPGDKDDPETVAFEARMRREAEDLKLESFGVELLHTIGNVYMMKATSFLKSRKFLGIPGFFSRLKEKGTVAKDAWGVIGSALGVQQVMQEMEKLQAKGELGEDELRALEEDMTGKIMLASWRGTRFEVVQVLREVADNVLKDSEVSDQVLYNRAKGLLFMGAIFKSTVPDESDEERRELERMVAEAASGKSKHHQMQMQARAAARAKRHQQYDGASSIHSASNVPKEKDNIHEKREKGHAPQPSSS